MSEQPSGPEPPKTAKTKQPPPASEKAPDDHSSKAELPAASTTAPKTIKITHLAPKKTQYPEDIRNITSDLLELYSRRLRDERGRGSRLFSPNFRFLTQDPDVQKLKKEILDLQVAVNKQASQLKTEQADRAQKDVQLTALTETLTELKKKQELDFLLSRVSAQAETAILTNQELRDNFFAEKEQIAFVVSIDIRRSTELMLKARTPALFAAFMTQLCDELEIAIKDEYGVFDKFTGDGVLAFFPEFFSGKDAGYHALAVAQKALAIFATCYRQNRSSFTTVLHDVNLTVGIDFGAVHLVQVAGGLTVVGGPVVYACRLSGGPPGSILLNQPAYERISDSYGSLCLISETAIDIKHEGGVVCYDLKPSNKSFVAVPPAWVDGAKQVKAESKGEEEGTSSQKTG